MGYTPHTIGEERRAHALDQAVRLASQQQIGSDNGDIIVDIASAFEKFLKDGDA